MPVQNYEPCTANSCADYVEKIQLHPQIIFHFSSLSKIILRKKPEPTPLWTKEP